MSACDSLEHPKLGVVIPLANEEATVAELLNRVCAQLSPNDAVFCVLDKASRDQTLERVKDYSQRDPRVQAVWAPENRCVVDAYFRGYKAALDGDCAWILEMDGGFSHLPEEIPRFINAMASGVDFAAGSRFMRGGNYLGKGKRFLVSLGGTLLANAALHTRMHDMTSGFECFSRKAMQYVVAKGTRSRAHFFQTEIRCMLHNWRWVEVPITYSNPSHGMGQAPVFEAMRILRQLRAERRQGKKSHV